MPAFKALNPNVSTESDYPPLIAAAGVLLLEANYITQLYLHNHSFYLRTDVWLRCKVGSIIVNLVP